MCEPRKLATVPIKKPFNYSYLCIHKVAESIKQKLTEFICKKLLNILIINIRPRVVLLHLLRQLLCYYKNYLNLLPVLNTGYKASKKYRNKTKVKIKTKKLQNQYLSNINQNYKNQCNFLSSFHQVYSQKLQNQ